MAPRGCVLGVGGEELACGRRRRTWGSRRFWGFGTLVGQRTWGSFSFLYIKKIKISKIYGRFEKFQNYTPVAPCLGDRT